MWKNGVFSTRRTGYVTPSAGFLVCFKNSGNVKNCSGVKKLAKPNKLKRQTRKTASRSTHSGRCPSYQDYELFFFNDSTHK